MLQLQDISYTVGERTLFQHVNWTIRSGKRIALVGPNGTGKTTLLRIIYKELSPTSGKITHPKKFTIGYLPQEEPTFEEGTVLRLVMQGNPEAVQIEEEMKRIHEQLESASDHTEKLVDQLGSLEARYGQIGGYALEAEAQKILAGLGFKEKDFSGSMSVLSGGWRMRVFLARMLLQGPDLMLLDEPTNHLDLPSLEWLENYLRNFSGSMIIVSHDRFFIDRLAQEIVELYNGRLTHYAGNYSFYEKQRALLHEQILKKYDQQKEERERLEKFINRFRYKASKAAQVQSRIKQLEKMERIELPKDHGVIHFQINADVQSYKDVLHLQNIWFRYDRDWVLEDLNLNIYRGEKIALIGENGAGKTTLTRLISHELLPQKGTIKWGERVHLAYYAQHQIDALDLSNTVFREVEENAAPSFRPKLRDILGAFQFTGEDVEKKIGVLSGGEKARVSLAKILLSPGNLLIMDEPTNHLDLKSKEALENALEDYNGTLLLISHDRYFLDKLVNRVIELRAGRLWEFEGNYSNYLDHKAAMIRLEDNSSSAETNRNSRQKKSKELKQKQARARQAISKERQRLTGLIESLEAEIERLEDQKERLELSLSNPESYQDPMLAITLQREYDSTLKELELKETQWEEAHLQLDDLLATMQSG